MLHSFHLGPWQIDPPARTLSCNGLCRQVEPRAMDVLVFLCERPREVVSAESLLEACWGSTLQGDNAVHKIITQLRRALDDSSTASRYIETIRKRGYRLIADVGRRSAASRWLHASPFRGLEAFDEQHADVFCGRAASTAQLLQAATAQARRGCALLLVLGPSGAGKTSLIQAGLLPALRAQAMQPDNVLTIDAHLQLDCADIARSSLLTSFASVLLDCELDGIPLFQHHSAAALAQRLRTDLPSVVGDLQGHGPRRRLLLVIDRFEAVFRLPDVDEADLAFFIALLDHLARSSAVLVVVACRNDFYPHLARYPALMAPKRHGGHVDVAPPSRAEIGQIIRLPAAAARLRFAVDPSSGLALDDLLEDAALAGPDTLPLLQYCLQELYRLRSPDGELRHAAFHELGGIEGAIGARAEQIVSVLGSGQVAALPGVLSRLLLVMEEDATVTSRKVAWSDLASDSEWQLVQALVDARLFVSDLHGATPVFGIAHEALLRRWPRVLDWTAQHRSALQARNRIGLQARRWRESGRPRDLLLPAGTQANQARQLLRQSGFAFSAPELEYMHTSLASVRRGTRLRRAVQLAVATLALLAGALGIAARSAQTRAELHRTEAEGLMSFMLDDFVDKLRPLGRLDLLDAVSRRALAYMANGAWTELNGATLAQRARALQVIAEVRIARADPAGAQTALYAARDILQRQLRAVPTDPALLKRAGENAFWLGQIQFDQKHWDAAAVHFGQYRDLTDRLARAAPDQPDSWIEQSFADNSLGTLALQRGDSAGAVTAFARSVDRKARAFARVPSDRALAAALADSLSWLASARLQCGELGAARSLYQREMDVLVALHAGAPDDATGTARLAAAWSHSAELKLALGDAPGSRADLGQALVLTGRLARQDESNRIWQRNWYLVQLKIVDLDAGRMAPALAVAELGRLHGQFARLSALEPHHANLRVLVADVVRRQAAFGLRLGRPADAAALLQPALSQLRALHADAPSDVSVRDALASALLLDAELQLAQDHAVRARASCSEVQSVLAPFARSADYHVLAPWAQAHACLGQEQPAAAARHRLDSMQYHDVVFRDAFFNRHRKPSNDQR
jgi:DNA-binding winged helix-turn-helix (wHTH) protein